MIKRFILMVALAAILSPVVAAPVDAGTLSRACMKSDRKAANRQLCNCIQKAARGNLSQSDQRMAAKFFKNPHMSQEIRQSDRQSHEVFWKRYKEFGTRVQQMCS